jgi:hypothetical protein
MDVCAMIVVVLDKLIDDLFRLLRRGGIIEIDNGLSIDLALQKRKI